MRRSLHGHQLISSSPQERVPWLLWLCRQVDLHFQKPFLSSDVHNVGFFLRKNAKKVDKAKFTTTMMQRLAGFPPHADSDRYNEAKEKLPFDGPLPPFELRSSNHIYHSNSNCGQVRTTAITFHCDQQHSSFLSRLLIR